jgi:DNA-binding response OmpR family regulator
MRMLVVEDDPKIASFLSKGFQENGFSVDEAGSGEDALVMATTREYDSAIVDLMLPGTRWFDADRPTSVGESEHADHRSQREAGD